MPPIAVLDDDPTGSQTVHDVAIVMALDEDELHLAGETTFFLTNTRSLGEPEAAELTERVARTLFERDPGVEIVSRSDSTLRGHVAAEVAAIRRASPEPYDGVLLVPAFFEAGRYTRGDVHYAGEVPVGETEFARDATFGYRSSNLIDFVREKTGEDAHSVSADDCDALTAGGWIVVNAESYEDLEAVVRAVRDSGRRFLYRSGPSFVRALAGLPAKPPLRDVATGDGHGLVVVGSHVGLTTRQVEATTGLREFELDVEALDPEGIGARVREALATDDVLIYTSRTLRCGGLETAREVSRAVTQVVRIALDARPGWVIAKGGITSHDVAVHGLGIRRATVLGQLLPGMISVFRPTEADPRAVGIPYVVFAGNVGDEHTLAEIVERFR
ncbi:four-carbon acid sugar kinase family protein [Solirubrobacter soli]|uniref:four-carbon acid sugar kinase family protein n=1 Tax=Solirubrobacter soli TaxID=363832 RepID=UPI0004096D8C|nr:four-carbon acid sugar kinase family protein [Solirubrobacter soli]